MAIKLTYDLITQAQKSWGDGIVKIGEAFVKNKNFKKEAENFIMKHYGYNEGKVLFKPTLAADEQFRGTPEKALSYFVGGNPACPEDHGFAIHPWVEVRFKNAGIVLNKTHALAMGNYFFTDKKGGEKKVEYSFGYFSDKKGNIKINLHHSSLPYSILK